MEHLIEHGADSMGTVFAQVFDLAMQIERERFLGAQLYERNPDRQGYANGYKAKRIDTPAALSRSMCPRRLAMMENRSIPSPLSAAAVRFGP